MAGANAWRQPTTMADWMRDIERRMLSEERRPQINTAYDLLGPGYGINATAINDWNSDEATFNGFFYTADAVLNSPNDTKWWAGQTISDEFGGGIQRVYAYADGSEPPTTYVRTFVTVNGFRTYTPWTADTGGGGGGGGGIDIQDENITVGTDVHRLDFHGTGVTVTAGTGEVVIDIPGPTDVGESVIAAKVLQPASFTQNIPDGVLTQINFTVLRHNFGMVVASDLDSITIPEDGIYMISAQLGWNMTTGGATSGRRFFMIQRNGSEIMRDERSPGISGQTRPITAFAAQWQLAAGDVITAWGQQSSGGALAISGVLDSYLSIFKVGGAKGDPGPGIDVWEQPGEPLAAREGDVWIDTDAPLPSYGSLGVTVQDENGLVATEVTQLDFQGAGVTASAGTGEVVVTIPGGSGTDTVLVPTVQVFTSTGSATWTKPTDCVYVEVEVQGAGGGGGGAAASGSGTAAVGGGGGGGGFARKTFLASALGSTESVTVGAGGAGGTAGANDGTAGGNSSFASVPNQVLGNGGSGGTGQAAVANGSVVGGGGGTGAGGDLSIRGGTGWPSRVAGGTPVAMGAGGGSTYGQACRPPSGTNTSAGVNGFDYGGGGSGGFNQTTAGSSAVAGGAGANGVVVVRSFVKTAA